MTKEEKNKFVDEFATKYNLLPYQVEILKTMIDMDTKRVCIVLPRLSGRTMLKKLYYEILSEIEKEELK